MNNSFLFWLPKSSSLSYFHVFLLIFIVSTIFTFYLLHGRISLSKEVSKLRVSYKRIDHSNVHELSIEEHSNISVLTNLIDKLEKDILELKNLRHGSEQVSHFHMYFYLLFDFSHCFSLFFLRIAIQRPQKR